MNLPTDHLNDHETNRSGYPTMAGVLRAKERIARFARRTPLEHSLPLSDLAGFPVYLKLECQQITGSFKVRGAVNKMLQLSDAEKSRGIIAASSGNHAQAVSYMAGKLGVDAMIVMPRSAPSTKVEGVRRRGGTAVLEGNDYDEAEAAAHALQRKTGRTFVHSFEDPEVICGQGTVGLEIAEDLPEVQQVIVPAGGGGLICGIATVMRAVNPDIRVIGVTGETSPAWVDSRIAGTVVSPPVLPSLADGTAGGISQYTFDLTRKLVDDFLLVPEMDIVASIKAMVHFHHQIIEGASALALAPVLKRYPAIQPVKTAVVLSGCNIDTATLMRVLGMEV